MSYIIAYDLPSASDEESYDLIIKHITDTYSNPNHIQKSVFIVETYQSEQLILKELVQIAPPGSKILVARSSYIATQPEHFEPLVDPRQIRRIEPE